METGQEPQKFDCRREEGKGIRDRLNDHVHKGFVFDKVWNPDSKKKKKKYHRSGSLPLTESEGNNNTAQRL